MTNATGTVTFEAGGETYTLRLTIWALKEIQKALKIRNLLQLEKALAAPSAENLGVLIGALMRGGGHEVSDDDAMKLPLSIGEMMKLVHDTMEAGMGVIEGAGDSGKPASPPKKTARKRRRRPGSAGTK